MAETTELRVGDRVVTSNGDRGTLKGVSRHPGTRKPMAVFVDTGQRDWLVVSPRKVRPA